MENTVQGARGTGWRLPAALACIHPCVSCKMIGFGSLFCPVEKGSLIHLTKTRSCRWKGMKSKCIVIKLTSAGLCANLSGEELRSCNLTASQPSVPYQVCIY